MSDASAPVDPNAKAAEQPPESDKLCNETKTKPGESLENNVAWVEEFKKTNPNPTAGYGQHVNALGLTTFACLDRLTNDSVDRVVLAGLEVLSQRAARKGSSGPIDKDRTPDDAAKRLTQSVEFGKRRAAMIVESQSAAVYDRVKANAAKAGIRLNLPDETADKGKNQGQGGKKQHAGAA